MMIFGCLDFTLEMFEIEMIYRTFARAGARSTTKNILHVWISSVLVSQYQELGDRSAFLLPFLRLPVIGLFSFLVKAPYAFITPIIPYVVVELASSLLQTFIPYKAFIYPPILVALFVPALAVYGLNFFRCFWLTTPFFRFLMNRFVLSTLRLGDIYPLRLSVRFYT